MRLMINPQIWRRFDICSFAGRITIVPTFVSRRSARATSNTTVHAESAHNQQQHRRYGADGDQQQRLFIVQK
jgi:hypothetical protein